MVEHYLAKVNTRVRFPPLAPFIKQSRFARDFLFSKEKEGRFAGLLRKDFLIIVIVVWAWVDGAGYAKHRYTYNDASADCDRKPDPIVFPEFRFSPDDEDGDEIEDGEQEVSEYEEDELVSVHGRTAAEISHNELGHQSEGKHKHQSHGVDHAKSLRDDGSKVLALDFLEFEEGKDDHATPEKELAKEGNHGAPKYF